MTAVETATVTDTLRSSVRPGSLVSNVQRFAISLNWPNQTPKPPMDLCTELLLTTALLVTFD